MLTPTLLDVASLTSLKPTGQTFDPDNHFSELSFDFARPAYGNFIIDHHDTSSAEVSDIEHVTFLTYWLSNVHFFAQDPFKFPKSSQPWPSSYMKGETFA
jgi:hypothetical protein